MKRLGPDDPVILNVKIPPELSREIRNVQDRENLSNRSEATRVILERGIAATNGAPA